MIAITSEIPMDEKKPLNKADDDTSTVCTESCSLEATSTCSISTVHCERMTTSPQKSNSTSLAVLAEDTELELMELIESLQDTLGATEHSNQNTSHTNEHEDQIRELEITNRALLSKSKEQEILLEENEALTLEIQDLKCSIQHYEEYFGKRQRKHQRANFMALSLATTSLLYAFVMLWKGTGGQFDMEWLRRISQQTKEYYDLGYRRTANGLEALQSQSESYVNEVTPLLHNWTAPLTHLVTMPLNPAVLNFTMPSFEVEGFYTLQQDSTIFQQMTETDVWKQSLDAYDSMIDKLAVSWTELVGVPPDFGVLDNLSMPFEFDTLQETRIFQLVVESEVWRQSIDLYMSFMAMNEDRTAKEDANNTLRENTIKVLESMSTGNNTLGGNITTDRIDEHDMQPVHYTKSGRGKYYSSMLTFSEMGKASMRGDAYLSGYGDTMEDIATYVSATDFYFSLRGNYSRNSNASWHVAKPIFRRPVPTMTKLVYDLDGMPRLVNF